MNILTRPARVSLATVAFAFMLGSWSAWAVNDEPLTEKWAPSEWGPDDKAGSVNRTTPAIVLNAIKLVKHGKVATLGKVYQQDALRSVAGAGE